MSTEQAIRDVGISPNVPDSNMEPANIVDVIVGAGINIKRGLQEIAKSLDKLADAIRGRL